MKNQEQVRLELNQWLEKKNQHDIQLNDDLNIIEAGIISSLDILELILLIEQLKGQKFNLKNIKAGSFNSINSIYNSFFAVLS